MSEDYLDISYPPATGAWVLPLITRINSSSSEILRKRMANWDERPPGGESSLGDLALSLSSKREMLPFVGRRLDNRLLALREHLDEPQMVECWRDKCAYRIREDQVVWELLLDLDCFFFEARSAFDVLDRFLMRFCRLMLERKVKKGDILRALAGRGGDLRWLEELTNSRDLFIHGAAPWIAFRVVEHDPFRYQLVVLKYVAQDLSDVRSWISMDQCRAIAVGLDDAFEELYRWAKEQITLFERSEAE